MSAVIARPACMRGQAVAWAKKAMVVSFGSVAVVVSTWWFGVSLPRKRAYAEYFKTFDWEREAQDMIRLGVYKSWNAKGERTGHPYD